MNIQPFTQPHTGLRPGRSAALLLALAALLALSLTTSLGTSTALAACGSTTNVADESALNAAIADFNSQTSACSYTIALTANIDLTASTTEINNGTANVDLLIDGASFAVDGQRNSGVRPFKIAANTVVEMRDLTVTGGQVATFSDHGGGILNNGGTLTLTTVTLTGNDAAVSATGLYFAWGGGLYNNGGIVTFQNNSLISNNEGEFGGGIYNANGGTVNIYDSTVTGNTSLGGGGVYNEDGLLNIDGSSFSGNDGSGGGAAIEAEDTITISNSQFIGVGTVGGPPISAGPITTISNSAISGYDSGFGAVVAGSSQLTVINTTISNNNTNSGGGIISFGFATINVINSTISGNTSDDSNIEGGIHMFSGTANIVNSTIAGNDRGIQVFDNSGIVNISNSLVINSTGDNCDINGTLNANGTNFTDDDTCSGLTNDSTARTNLGPLQDNGGPTFTHALLDGNPAINAGDNALAVDENGDPLITDQRGAGFPRIIGNAVDVGAFESEFISNEPPTAEAGGPYTIRIKVIYVNKRKETKSLNGFVKSAKLR